MNPTKRFSFGRILLFLFIILFLLIGRPTGFLICTYIKDKKLAKLEKTGYTNDASHLNETKVDSVVTAFADIDQATTQISQLIKLAKEQGKKISIAGAQHSMGGHTIYPDGIVLDMKGFRYMELDSTGEYLLVGSGALWSEIIPYLNLLDKSVSVMQSNNSFSVGGSISVNCHGWQPNSPPIASTVRSFRLINADGKILNCSRTENTDLFSLVLGGYGLFGVILDVELKVVPNKMYTAHQYVIKSADYIKEYDRLANSEDIGMVYGRININPDNFMGEAILSTFSIDDNAVIEPLEEGTLTSLRRTVFRGSANNAYGKNLRWRAEKFGASQINGKKFSRNNLLNESVEVFQNRDTAYTDILHEYFIPKDQVGNFIDSLKKIIPAYKVDLLNITVRNVKRDEDAFLKYANEEVFGFVMLFNQEKTHAAEMQMKAATERMIDAAISLKGTYYLPYRLHATKEQMNRAYPQATQFFLLKKKYDPAEIFQNKFYQTYR